MESGVFRKKRHPTLLFLQESRMKEIASVLDTVNGSGAERQAAQRAFMAKRQEVWNAIHCVSAKVFRYIDNNKWKAEMESGGRRNGRSVPRCCRFLTFGFSIAEEHASTNLQGRRQKSVNFGAPWLYPIGGVALTYTSEKFQNFLWRRVRFSVKSRLNGKTCAPVY
jgi:hypothetical protein